jgi:hypothetical protein
MMYKKQWLLIVINIIGGVAVLGSYAHGILTHPDAGQILWGGVPQVIRPLYTTNMLLAAAGYFSFTYFILFRLHPTETRIASRLGYGAFNTLYTAILIPSALWMPLTILAVEQSSQALLWTVRLVLWVVGAASLGLFLSLLKVKPKSFLWARQIALLGSAAFCLQTALLDAVIWVIFFRL